jgi:hypothetical protein
METRLIGQVIGIIGFFVFAYCMSRSTKKAYYRSYAASCLTFGLHYFFMGVYMLVPMVLLAALRTAALSTETGWKYRYYISFTCLAIVAPLTLMIEQSFWSYIFVLSLTTTVLSELYDKLAVIRINNFLSRSMYLIFYILIGSIGGIFSEVMSLSSIIYASVRDYVLPHLNKQAKETL